MSKLDRELIAALTDLAARYREGTTSRHVDQAIQANAGLSGVLGALREVEEVLTEGYVYYSLTEDKLLPAAFWVKLDGGAWMAAAANESRMPWDEIIPITQLPMAGLVYRNKWGMLVDPRKLDGYCENCGLNPESAGFRDNDCAQTGVAHQPHDSEGINHHGAGIAD